MHSLEHEQSFENKVFADRLGREFTVEEQDDHMVLCFVATKVKISQTAEHFHSQLYQEVTPETGTDEEAA